jgi:hypothetical protein
MATTIPITTNTMIAICVQTQNGDMARRGYSHGRGGYLREPGTLGSIV